MAEQLSEVGSDLFEISDFATASGEKIKVSKEALSRARENFKAESESLISPTVADQEEGGTQMATGEEGKVEDKEAQLEKSFDTLSQDTIEGVFDLLADGDWDGEEDNEPPVKKLKEN